MSLILFLSRILFFPVELQIYVPLHRTPESIHIKVFFFFFFLANVL